MILVDTSVWIDHFHRAEPALTKLLGARSVRMHPAVVGELAMGNLRNRNAVLADLRALPHAKVATLDELLHMVNRHRLYGRGIGYIDAHLLASTVLTGDRLWVRDQRVLAVAQDLGVGVTE
jgi:predicted nucleic acid-binding protein